MVFVKHEEVIEAVMVVVPVPPETGGPEEEEGSLVPVKDCCM